MNVEKRINSKGALTVPVAMRRALGMSKNEKVALEPQENGNILINRVEGTCIFCGGTKDLTCYKKKYICAECAKALGGK